MVRLHNDEVIWREGSDGVADQSNILEASPSAPNLNAVTGCVSAISHGLTRAWIHIQVGEKTDLRVKQLLRPDEVNDVQLGQRVIATIPPEAVRLEAGEFRQGKSRWNRWIGRIVLVEPERTAPLITVKLHGDSWTLKSTGPVVCLSRRPQAWDTVNIVVDPAQVRVAVRIEPSSRGAVCSI